MKYSSYVMKALRQRRGLNENDNTLDNEFEKMSKSDVFSEVLKWEGLLGSWDSFIKELISDIYGVDLKETEE